MRIPWLAAMEVEMATTSGMARPRACGQAITRTETALSSAKSGPLIKAQTPNEIRPAARAT